MRWPTAPLTVLLAALASQQAVRSRAQEAEPSSVVATPLRITSERPFCALGYRLFVSGFQCDTDGNVFFLPGLAGDVGYPAEIVRVPSDGASTSRVDIPSVLGVSDAKDVAILSMAVDPQGGLHVLASGPRARDTASGGGQRILSFGSDGQLLSDVALNASELVADSLAAFDSGEFLLIGREGGAPKPRVAVLPRGGQPLRDVLPQSRRDMPRPRDNPKSLTTGHDDAPLLAVANSDGCIYMTSQAGTVQVVSSAGRVIREIRVASSQRDGRLMELKVSGQRLAAVYSVPLGARSVRWIEVYSVESGEHVASYGPVTHLVMCYRPEGARDRFTLLAGKRGRSYQLEASAP
jgi:hypothetical protein